MNMSKKSSPLKFLKNSSENTITGYAQTIKKYEEFHNMSMNGLVCEALDEQDNQVPSHRLKIIERIESFQDNLINQGLVYGTILTHMGRIKTIYHKNRVNIPYIEPVNPKRAKRREYIEYKDILTKDEIRCALQYMRLPAQARALTIIQGGLSNEECEHLTTRAFIDENYKYHQKDNDVDALRWLASNPIIWVTKLIRWKTKKPYYAIIGAEAVNRISEAKIYEMDLPSNNGKIPEKLLNTNKGAFQRLCKKVNDKCGFGTVAEESKFRSHNLRRFHATYIRGSALSYEERSILSNREIDEMQGRGKTNTQDTYIKSNPLEQKLLYAKVMNNISLYNEYDYEITEDDVIIRVRNQSLENQKLREEVKNLSNQLQKKKVASEKVDALRNELGDDVFKELINEILTTS